MYSNPDCGDVRPAANQSPQVLRLLQELVAAQVAASQGELAAHQAEATARLQQLYAATAGAQAATAAGLEAHVAQQQQAAAGTAGQAAGLKSQVDALAAGLAAQQGSVQAALQQLEGVQADRLQAQAGLLEPMQGALKQLDALQTQVRTPRSALKPCSLAHSCNAAYRPGVSAQIRIYSRPPCRAHSSSLFGCKPRPKMPGCGDGSLIGCTLQKQCQAKIWCPEAHCTPAPHAGRSAASQGAADPSQFAP